jgi:glycosyltransferase involved in cell wall biosynthesis
VKPRAERRLRATDELIDRVALDEMDGAHPDLKLNPVAVVIAAYHEADNIGHVVAGMPAQVNGEDVSVVVVVDGEDDGSAAIVREAGQVACIAPVNRGQGAALRLGYRIAHDHGAQYIVTADADGQSEPADLAVVLEPVMAGELDFVNGSRRLGSTESNDLARNSGVLVFASLISLLTGTRVTDPANPIRAMRADVPAHLTLDEHQYQASELLIGAVMRGYRIGERPVSMLARTSGTSKKGGNLAYGYRYGRVVVRTWWRERAHRASVVHQQAEVTLPADTP